MITLHDAVPRSLFNRVKGCVESDLFPWFYIPFTAYIDSEKKVDELENGSFTHIAFNAERPNSEFSDILESCLHTCLDKLDVRMKKLLRIRVGLMTISPTYIVHMPHIDLCENHTVGLLYLNDSDGDTFIYNEKFDGEIAKTQGDRYGNYKDMVKYYHKILKGKVTVMEKSTPEENKFLLFNGMHYHSSSTPIKTKRRIVINYVFETND